MFLAPETIAWHLHGLLEWRFKPNEVRISFNLMILSLKSEINAFCASPVTVEFSLKLRKVPKHTPKHVSSTGEHSSAFTWTLGKGIQTKFNQISFKSIVFSLKSEINTFCASPVTADFSLKLRKVSKHTPEHVSSTGDHSFVFT